MEVLEKSVITKQDVLERIKNKKTEELSSQDVFDRYIVYGSEKELNTPEIQELLIKHGFKEELLELLENEE